MDSYVSREEARRKQGQIFGTADEQRILRAISAKANASRRIQPSKQQTSVSHKLLTASRRSDRVA